MFQFVRRGVKFIGPWASGKSRQVIAGAAGCERLERRRLLSGNTFTVTDTSDSIADTGSLRFALSQANAASGDSTISFDATAFPAAVLTTITLGGTPLSISNATGKITIDGLGAGRVAISGGATTANGQTTGGSTVFAVNANATAEIDGITILNGNALNNPAGFASLNGSGGGVYNLGSLVLGSDKISGNLAELGGGIFNATTLSLFNTIISGNHGNSGAGGLDQTSGAIATLIGDTFSANTSTTSVGGILGEQATFSISATNFNANTGASGGAITIAGGSLSLTGSNVSSNTVAAGNGSSPVGGGIFANGGSVTLLNDTFAGNSAVDGGAIDSSASLSITACTFASNTATDTGGAIYASGNTLAIVNSTFANNIATSVGGAIFDNDFKSQITDTTIAGNLAPQGGGIYDQFVAAIIDGTMIATNAKSTSDSSPSDWTGIAANTSSSNNLLGVGGTSGLNHGFNGNLVGTTASPIAPLLGAFASNGGPTQTLALLPGSPAIAAGNNFLDVNNNPITTDQRKLPRPTETPPDIGAVPDAAGGAGHAPLGLRGRPVEREHRRRDHPSHHRQCRG